MSAGAARDPDPAVAARDALLDRMLELPPPPAPGMLAKLLGKHSPPPEAVALVVDVVDEPAPVELLAWLADLHARDIDVSWVGNESGPGLVHTIEQPLGEALDVRSALLAPACGWIEDLELDAITDGIQGHAVAWLDPGTPHARPAWRLFLPGSAILATLRRTVDQPTTELVTMPVERSMTTSSLGWSGAAPCTVA